MSNYTFNTDRTEDRVKLDIALVKRAVSSVKNNHQTRKGNRRWSPEDLVKACELYTSGFKATEISEVMGRPYVSVNVKLNCVFGRRAGVHKYSNPAYRLHEENRVRNIVGQKDLMTWDNLDKKYKK